MTLKEGMADLKLQVGKLIGENAKLKNEVVKLTNEIAELRNGS
jgi:regulator of replication initiation timing